eukprot:gene11858-15090_t
MKALRIYAGPAARRHIDHSPAPLSSCVRLLTSGLIRHRDVRKIGQQSPALEQLQCLY